METGTTERPGFSSVFLKEAGECTTLGPAYYNARAIVDHVMPDGDETLEQVMLPVAKKFVDDAYALLAETVQSWLFIDVSNNLQHQLWKMVDACVVALLGGENWAVKKYVLGDRYDCAKLRATLAALVPKELQDARVADLEKELADAKDSLRRAEERNRW